MSMRRRFIILPFVLILASGCVAHMRVRTEIYVGDNLPKDPLPATVKEIASIAQNALVGYEDHTKQVAVSNYKTLIDHVLRTFPKEWFGGPDSETTYLHDFAAAVDEALRPVHEHAESVRILAQQLGAPSDKTVPIFADTGNLEQGVIQLHDLLAQTADQGLAAVNVINSAEAAAYQNVIRHNFQYSETRPVKGKSKTVLVYPGDALLARLTARKTIASDADRSAAIGQVIRSVAAVQAEGDARIRQALVSPALDASRIVITSVVVPLDDPAVQTIVDEKNEVFWKKAVNDVESWNWIGNSEVAFRMDHLGDSHIKGVLFDPSEAMKTGFNVFTKALEITASAYGAHFASSSSTTTASSTTTGSSTTTTATTPTPPPAGSASGADTTAATNQATSATSDTLSKPAIDAEIARRTSVSEMRAEAVESAFWNLINVGKSLPADGDASAAAKKLLALVKCTENELADPQGRRCGGDE